MSLTNRQDAERRARLYIGTDQLLEDLGSGAEGFVFPSPSGTAVKVLKYPEKFERELAAYQRLEECGVNNVCGFAVPKLIGFNRDLLIIEMTIVQPPYILDFAQAHLDLPKDFNETDEEMWERFAPLFDERLEKVQDIYYFLQNRCGIFYYDIAPRNINFGDEEQG